VKLKLWHLQEDAPGMVFWHPRGYAVYRVLEDYVRRKMRRAGYAEIRTPQLLPQELWGRSGHWDKFGEHMFRVDDGELAMALKPMSCPCHVQIFNKMRSWRELPIRYAEFGACHRNEPSGSLHGIMRTRAFEQDDAHVRTIGTEDGKRIPKLCKTGSNWNTVTIAAQEIKKKVPHFCQAAKASAEATARRSLSTNTPAAMITVMGERNGAIDQRAAWVTCQMSLTNITRRSTNRTGIALRSSICCPPCGFRPPRPCDADTDRMREREQCLFKHRQFQPIGNRRAGFIGRHQISLAQDGEMRRQGWLRDRHARSNLPCGHRPVPEQLQDASSRGVREGFEYGVHISLFS
jgi:hypothetical protein